MKNYTQLLQAAGFDQDDQTFFLQTLDLKKNKPAKFAKIGKKADKKFRAMNRTLRGVDEMLAKQETRAAKVNKFEDKKHVRWTQETLNFFNRYFAPYLGAGEITDQQIFWQEYIRHLHTYQPILAMFECRVRKHFDKYAVEEVAFCGEAVGGRLIEFDNLAAAHEIALAVDGVAAAPTAFVNTFYTKLQARVVRGEQIAELRAIFRRDLDKMAALWTSLR